MSPTPAAAPPQRSRFPNWLVPAFGYGVSAASLYWVFSRFPYAQLGEHLRTLDWRWVAVAIVLEFSVYFFDAWRWMALVKTVGAPSFRTCLQSVFVGIFANDILPARAGELVRCFLLSYESDVPLTLSFTSSVLLRIMDGIWIAILYVCVTWQIASHIEVNRIMWGFGIGVGVISILFLLVLFHRHSAHAFVRNTPWVARFIHLLDEIHRLGHWQALRQSLAIGGLYWLAQAGAIFALFHADAFDLGISASIFLLIVKSVGTLVPNAPANMGAYQATTVYALGFLLVERPNAQIFSEIMFVFLTLPGLVGGAISVAFAGVDITTLHKRAHSARAATLPPS